MTHEEILTKAIEKAVKNGWLSINVSINVKNCDCDDHCSFIDILTDVIPRKVLTRINVDFIFSHDFAKSFWGFKQVSKLIGVEKDNLNEHAEGGIDLQMKLEKYRPFIFAWEYHLQQMVIEPDPISYLEKFI